MNNQQAKTATATLDMNKRELMFNYVVVTGFAIVALATLVMTCSVLFGV